MSSSTATPRADTAQTAIAAAVNATIASLPAIPADPKSAIRGSQSEIPASPAPAALPSVQNIQDQLSGLCDLCGDFHAKCQPCNPSALAALRKPQSTVPAPKSEMCDLNSEISDPNSESSPQPQPLDGGPSPIENRNSKIENPRGGPRTPEGKARSRLNALKHGLTAQIHILLPGEDPDEYQHLTESMLQDLKPASVTEHILVQRLTNLTWRLLRTHAAEAEIFRQLNENQSHAAQEHNERYAREYAQTHYYSRTRKEDPPKPPLPVADRSPAQLLADQFIRADDKTNPFARLHRYESSLQRSFDKTLSQLRQLQAGRTQNELKSQNEPAPAPDICNLKPEIPNVKSGLASVSPSVSGESASSSNQQPPCLGATRQQACSSAADRLRAANLPATPFALRKQRRLGSRDSGHGQATPPIGD